MVKKKAVSQRKSANRGVTLDRLAGMVQGGFVDLETRLGKRIDDVESRLTSRIDGVEQKVDALRSEVQMMHFDHKRMQARIESIEIKVFGSIQEL